jgi:hypothetical protein
MGVVQKSRIHDRLGRPRTVYHCPHGHWHVSDRQARVCIAREKRKAAAASPSTFVADWTAAIRNNLRKNR